jgi:hypothetical protein
LRCRISATKARLSASSDSFENGDAEATGRPLAVVIRGNLAGSCFIHSGT